MKQPIASSLLRVNIQRIAALLVLASTILFMITLLLPMPSVQAQGAQPVAIYFFWGDGCPHCAEAGPFLAALAQHYPNVKVRAYEVWYNEKNQMLFTRMATAYGFEPSGVPTIFIGDRYWIGYAEQMDAEIEAATE